ncbi:MAG TPA: GNAT family protein [Edaphobacter sp.]|jgi:ribosomal-protein-alanine N-acetyltransferase|nr:GNAT family protein [Edaphobacter sp.]
MMQLQECGDIVTSRLILIAITPETIQSEKTGDNRLGELIGCTIPANWPPVDWEPHVLDFFLTLFDQHPNQIGWFRYVALPFSDGFRTLIGTVGGGFIKPEAPHEAEFGYAVLPQFEGRGFTTEAAKAMVEFFRNNERINSLIAHTFPSIPASIRVMEKCGMTYDGEGKDPGTIRYRLQLRPPK